MKITVLLENAPRPGFKAEHGLSLLVEALGRTILFDFGQSDAFARNAQALGADLSKVDFAVLSHGHYDHGGGIAAFLARNDHAPVYVSREAFRNFRHGAKYIGLAPELEKEPRLVRLSGDLTLLPGITLRLCAGLEKRYPSEQDGLTVGGEPDAFRHEICLEIREGDRKTLISGCSHNGIENLLSWFLPDRFVGGLHTRNVPLAETASLARALEVTSCTFLTGHCTGREQFGVLKEVLGDRIEYLYTGQEYLL